MVKKGKQGFASMSPEKRREIASRGGKMAHALGVAHQWDSTEAAAAGRKGGSIARANDRRAREIAAGMPQAVNQ